MVHRLIVLCVFGLALGASASASVIGVFDIVDGSTETYVDGIDGLQYQKSIAQGRASGYLRLPEGVTYTSESGQFLTTAQPVLVPEPATTALMLCGVGLLGGLAARHRRARAQSLDG